MKYALLGITALAALIAACVLGYRWDASINRGHTWGYWGEFNTISNSLAKLPGVNITAPWYNADVTLEEFGFDVVGRAIRSSSRSERRTRFATFREGACRKRS